MDLKKIEPPEDTRLSITDYGNFDDTKEQTEATDNEDDFDSNENNKEKHRKSIDHIFVSQYINDTDNEEYDAYVVTYSKDNNSVLGWYVNIEKNKHIQPKSDEDWAYNHCLIDLNSDRLSSSRYLELKCPYSFTEYSYVLSRQAIGFLPEGDLIQ
ncbi:hypothetical protein RhiirA4_481214, partial [Rhizophagus irregularis]